MALMISLNKRTIGLKKALPLLKMLAGEFAVMYMCTSEDQTIISHAHGIVGKFRWLCPSAG